MARQSPFGSRLVSLVAAASTLLAAWQPPGRACACGPIGENARPAATTAETAPLCPCCGQRPANGKAPKPCCVPPAGERTGCGCGPVGRSDQPQPAAPPSHPDDAPVSGLAGIASAWVNVSSTAGPTAAELVVHLAAPPPTDRVISLSRLTC